MNKFLWVYFMEWIFLNLHAHTHTHSMRDIEVCGYVLIMSFPKAAGSPTLDRWFHAHYKSNEPGNFSVDLKETLPSALSALWECPHCLLWAFVLGFNWVYNPLAFFLFPNNMLPPSLKLCWWNNCTLHIMHVPSRQKCCRSRLRSSNCGPVKL